VFVGRISYSLYLWHLPVLVLLGVTTTEAFAEGGLVLQLLALALSVGAATASYYWVELPFLRRKHRLSAPVKPDARERGP
jgi:peptidoglycan/LPS O-acetylase OafA/YrhL